MLFESAAYEITFHSIPNRAVFHRGELGHVPREIVFVYVGFVWLYVEVVFPCLGRSSCSVPVGDNLWSGGQRGVWQSSLPASNKSGSPLCHMR